jgi:hypothetical protein
VLSPALQPMALSTSSRSQRGTAVAVPNAHGHGTSAFETTWPSWRRCAKPDPAADVRWQSPTTNADAHQGPATLRTILTTLPFLIHFADLIAARATMQMETMAIVDAVRMQTGSGIEFNTTTRSW